ncbi:site-specific integrase [Pseudomonas alabamensis]|uniref:site-specific integrase n=1 Tax=Pseudomonas alabamensis TaxID=3064349 RepID=UPI003F652AA4
MSECATSAPTGTLPTDKTFISINELSSLTGLSVEQVLRKVLSDKTPIVYEANSRSGFLVEDIADVERDCPETGGYVLDSAMEIGTAHVFRRPLKIFDPRSTILSIIESGVSEEVVFRVWGKTKKRQAAFFDLPGIELTSKNVLILKMHAELLASSLAMKSLPKLGAAISGFEAPAAASVAVGDHPTPSRDADWAHGYACECCRPSRATELASSILALFLDRKQSSWRPDQQKKMKTQCTTFIELMNDPPLGSLNRQMIWDYEAKLKKMPSNRYGAARRHGTNDALRLLELAESLDEQRLSSKSVERYMDSLSSMFAWAKENMILTNNPAERVLAKSRKTTRAQDERQPFSNGELMQIFSAQWFTNGTGARNSRGRFYQFRPHYYWLPLLGLYTGGRLNELSQLYISDVGVTDSGVHFLDFNLNAPDKLDIDGGDKSLKNLDSQRIVSLHPHLIELGFSTYVKALSAAGYLRVFPELKHDAIKGYGKPAGSWFNERFLGKQLNMPRDGKRTFHSFRHTFITALAEHDVPQDVQSQLAGHSRGESITSKRYRKDTGPERLLSYVKLLDFELPKIRPFIIADGLEAVSEGLNRKARFSKLASKRE